MNQVLKITTNPNSLECTIGSDSMEPRIYNDLKVFWQSFSTEYNLVGKEVHLPLFIFKRSLLSLLGYIRAHNIELSFDTFTEGIITEFLRDQKSFKTRQNPFYLDESEIGNHLRNLGFKRTLKLEQLRDSHELLKCRHGANFSVPGAGKTTTLLAIHCILKELKLVNKLIVVSPINAFVSWEDEINEIFGSNKFHVLRITKEYFKNYQKFENGESDVLLINYEKLRQNTSNLVKFFIKNKVHFILDESHRVKSGFNNLSYRNIIQLADVSTRRDIMSGTPMPQIYSDLIPQFDFIWPGEKIITEINLIENRDLLLQRINESITGLYVRTKKSELGLVPPIIKYNYVPLGPLQGELYRLIRSEYERILSGMDQSSRQYFRSMGRSVVRLLQAGTNPMLLTTNDGYEEDLEDLPANTEIWEVLEQFSKFEKPVKIEAVIKRTREIIESSGKVVIWSSFVRNILLLKRLLAEFNPAMIYGAISAGDESDPTSREGQIRMFHNDESCKLLIANPQACGEGISLHKICHNAIYLDRNFNAAHYLQSMDRIHRLGLKQGISTTIDIFISENTIDVPLIQRLNEKVENMGRILNDDSLLELVYDPADIVVEVLDKKDIVLIKDHILGV